MKKDARRPRKNTALEVVKTGRPTRNGMGTIFRLEPGKRVVLGQWDQWEGDEAAPLHDRLARVSYSQDEQERREQGVLRLKEQFSSVPWYVVQALKHGDGYWEKLYSSMRNL